MGSWALSMNHEALVGSLWREPFSLLRIGSLLPLWRWIQPQVPKQKTLPVDDGWQGDLVRRWLDSGDQWKQIPNLSPSDAFLRSLALDQRGFSSSTQIIESKLLRSTGEVGRVFTENRPNWLGSVLTDEGEIGDLRPHQAVEIPLASRALAMDEVTFGKMLLTDIARPTGPS
jgi:hypothetical protein